MLEIIIENNSLDYSRIKKVKISKQILLKTMRFGGISLKNGGCGSNGVFTSSLICF